MKVYLDDLRETPAGWTRTYTVEQTIDLLKTNQVEALSLDNDLGENEPEGWKVLDWLEEQVTCELDFPIPELAVHSANSVRVKYMYQTIESIRKIRERQTDELSKEAVRLAQSK